MAVKEDEVHHLRVVAGAVSLRIAAVAKDGDTAVTLDKDEAGANFNRRTNDRMVLEEEEAHHLLDVARVVGLRIAKDGKVAATLDQDGAWRIAPSGCVSTMGMRTNRRAMMATTKKVAAVWKTMATDTTNRMGMTTRTDMEDTIKEITVIHLAEVVGIEEDEVFEEGVEVEDEAFMVAVFRLKESLERV